MRAAAQAAASQRQAAPACPCLPAAERAVARAQGRAAFKPSALRASVCVRHATDLAALRALRSSVMSNPVVLQPGSRPDKLAVETARPALAYGS